MKTHIVLGTLFGDEGKGLTVSSLSTRDSLVIRFNAGSQCGHTVVKDGYRHIFSSFGSGTLNGAHTFISEYCTLYPVAYFNEKKALVDNGFNPICYIHPLTMITTPFDIDYNRGIESVNKHGSVGVGFGATIERNENTPYKLYAIDLTCRDILIHKLNNIASHYGGVDIEERINSFLYYIDNIEWNIKTLPQIFNRNDYDNIIFEGGQGIMLDMDFGFFPNVTRSNTTSKNAMKIIKEHDLPNPDIYYVMRSYLTRHGNGFMPNERPEFNFEDMTNVAHEYQGKFRQGYHSLEMLRYAIKCDCTFSGNHFHNKNLVVTCLDQTDNKVLIDNDSIDIEKISDVIGFMFGVLYINDSPTSERIRKFIKERTPIS